MPIRIKNWKLNLLALFFIGVFASLGMWQLSRAKEKEALIASYTARTQQAPLSGEKIQTKGDWRFYRASLQGTYDNDHSVLLDNKIQDGKIGYELYTPFRTTALPQPILVDRGFIPMGISRATLPTIPPITGTVTLTGILNSPPTYVAYGQLYESANIIWPLRVEYINLKEISRYTGTLYSFYVLQLIENAPGANAVNWQIVTMPPEKHRGYALQWFAFALTLLVISVALNRR